MERIDRSVFVHEGGMGGKRRGKHVHFRRISEETLGGDFVKILYKSYLQKTVEQAWILWKSVQWQSYLRAYVNFHISRLFYEKFG
jgi:hypothetical protein